MRRNYGRNESAQILLITGLIMIVAYLLIASVSIRLSNVDFNSGDEFSANYKDVREKFGTALTYQVEILSDDYPDQNQTFDAAFQVTEQAFARLMGSRGITFDADVETIGYNETGVLTWTAIALYLNDGYYDIDELIYYTVRE